MLILPAGFEGHIQQDATRLTISGQIERTDGEVIRVTQSDRRIEIIHGPLAGIYEAAAPMTSSDIKSSSDLSVDNMDMESVFNDALIFTGFTAADVESGLFDNARFQTFLHRWDDPDEYQKIIRRGYLGAITRTAEGEFTAEWRGLTQILQQMVGKTYGERCDVKKFGDARCGFDAEAASVGAVVTQVFSRRRFIVDMGITGFLAFPSTFDLGNATFPKDTNGGLNAGYGRQIKTTAVAGSFLDVEVWEPFSFDVTVGDELILRPGCDRRWDSCILYNNTINFRGHGRWIPGVPKIIRAP